MALQEKVMFLKKHRKNDALENKVEAKRDEDANIILSKNVKVDMDTWHTGINDNIFVVGGSGTGKTRYFVKPSAPVRAV